MGNRKARRFEYQLTRVVHSNADGSRSAARRDSNTSFRWLGSRLGDADISTNGGAAATSRPDATVLSRIRGVTRPLPYCPSRQSTLAQTVA